MNTKIRIRVGDIEVACEGSESFVEKKLLGLITELSKLDAKVVGQVRGKTKGGGDGDPGPLATFLESKDVKSSQRKRFLATAEWLHRKGTSTLQTRDVISALKESRQTKLSNPSDCLSKNVKKGFCEKTGGKFYVTDEGRKYLS